MSTPPAQGTYTCPYCRHGAATAADRTCPHCGAPVDVRLRVSDSGWVEQPPIRDMARIRFSRSTCQISGKYVPVAEMNLHDDDWVYFSHHVLLHTDPRSGSTTCKMKGAWNRMHGRDAADHDDGAQGPGHIAFSADHPGRDPGRAAAAEPGRRRGRAPLPGRDRERHLRLAELQGLVHHPGRRRQRGVALPARPDHRPVRGPGRHPACCCCTPRATRSSATCGPASGSWSSRAG